MILTQLLIVFFWSSILLRVSNSLLLFYLVLALYSIIPQIGYIYFPELSVAIDAYFGEFIVQKFQFFFLLNLAVIPIAFYLSSKITITAGYSLNIKGFSGIIFFWFFCLAFLFFMWTNYFFNKESLNYATASAASSSSIMVFIFPILNKIGIGLAILSFAHRQHSTENQLLSYFFIFSIVIFSFTIGARVDILSLAMGLLVLTLLKRKLNFVDAIKIIFIIPFVFILLLFVEASRNEMSILEIGFTLQDFLSKDFLGPGHTVFGLIYFDYINPLDQFVNGLMNSLPGLPRLIPGSFPLLSETVGAMISEGKINISRTQGYAFHLLGEGYVFMGMWGFVFNFLAFFVNLSIFKIFQNSFDSKGQEVFAALFATLIFPLVRAQFSYFLELFFSYLVPIMILHFLFCSNLSNKREKNGS